MNALLSNPLRALREAGQSVWLDDIGRTMLDDGSLARMIEMDGIAGVTSNPAILAHSMMSDPRYADSLMRLLPASATELYEALLLDDLRRAADLLQATYARTAGADGFVNLEVSPHLAGDAPASIAEAQRLWQALDRPNAMIKVPGTVAGLAALRELIAAGINVNVTLLFSPERYRAVAQAWMDGLEQRAAAGQTLRGVASVASFFLSRIDSKVDRLLAAAAPPGRRDTQILRGQAAVASASRAHEICREIIASPRWQALAAQGACPQRLLWASTSTKDPAYSPVKYVEELVIPGTVTTLPLETIEAYRRLGRPTVRSGYSNAAARAALTGLAELGIDMETVAAELEQEGIQKFREPFDRLQEWLKSKQT